MAPFQGRGVSVYRLVASRNYTAITYRCGTECGQGLTPFNAGQSSFVASLSPVFCSLTSNSPILVLQIGLNYWITTNRDFKVALVAPITGHVSRTQFSAWPFNFLSQHFISIMVQAQFFNESQILLDGHSLDCINSWSAIYDIITDSIVGYGCTANVTQGNSKWPPLSTGVWMEHQSSDRVFISHWN